MLTDRIQEKLNELSTLPGVVAIGLGKKIIGGVQTDTIGITFSVKTKEANPDDMLPTSVDIDGVTYITDVIEIGEIVFASCPGPAPFLAEDYILSGIQISGRYRNDSNDLLNLNYRRTESTLGIIAYHPSKKILVGITAAHILPDASESSTINKEAYINFSDRSPAVAGQRALNYNLYEQFIFHNAFKNYGIAENWICKLFNYIPLKVKPESDPNRFNQVDASLLFFWTRDTFTNIIPDTAGTSFEISAYYDPSWRSYHVKGIPEITSPMPFATTAELNALISSPPSQVSSSGVGTGPKHGVECGLKIDSIGATTSFTTSTMPGIVYFNNLISFSTITPGNPAVAPKDSGAALLAKIGGIWKIIGLVIGGNETVGYACRIDYIAQNLGVEAWDGSIKDLGVFTSSYGANPLCTYIFSPGANDANQITLGDRIYYQTGITTLPAVR